MILKQRLFSNMFLRNMLADFGNRSAYSKMSGAFIPYFQYRIGSYQPDHYMYFPTEPYALRYQNEIFNKLYEYKGYDIITYLDFHYSAYDGKYEFLRFLQYEITDRLKQKPKEVRHKKLETAAEWVREQRQELQQIPIKPATEQTSNENLSVDPVSNHQDDIDEWMDDLSDSCDTGDIVLYNKHHEAKLIKFLKLLQTVQAPPHIAKAEQVFEKFSDTDIAAILRLHFAAFKNRKINTLQRKIRIINSSFGDKNPKVLKLEHALQEFFYS